MKLAIHIAGVVMIFNSILFAQIDYSTYNFHAGVGLPQNPQSFSDYWNSGPVIGMAIGQTSGSSTLWRLALDYGRFSLNKEKFVEGTQSSKETTAISGGHATLIAASGTYQVYLKGESANNIYLFGGASYIFATTGEAVARYGGIEIAQPRVTYGSLSLSFGAGISIPYSTSADIYLESRYFLGVLKNEKANSDFLVLCAGVAFHY